MNNKSEEIKQANTIKDLYKHLEWVMGETERIIGSRKVSFEDVHKMADYLKDIRLLLNELNCREAWPGKTGAAGSAGEKSGCALSGPRRESEGAEERSEQGSERRKSLKA